jgi:hypothetical protein
MQRRSLTLLAALALILIGLAWWRGEAGSNAAAPATASATSPAERSTSGLQPAPAASGSDAPAAPAAPKHKASPARSVSPERQQFRQRVLDALNARESRGARAAAVMPAPGAEPKVYPPGTMKDRSGLMGAEVRVINRELMPLIDECYDRQLHGMLALGVVFASEQDAGAIIESVEPTARNEVPDEELIDCIRQSAFTIEFPHPVESSRREGELTIPLGIETPKQDPPKQP